MKEGTGAWTRLLTPTRGYEVDEVAVDGELLPLASGATSYTFLPVTGDHSLAVTCRLVDGVLLTRAPSAATVRRGRTALLEYAVEQGVRHGRADVTIRIVDDDAQVVKTLRRRGVALNRLHEASFVCSLDHGDYTFLVSSRTSDGADSANVASNLLDG